MTRAPKPHTPSTSSQCLECGWYDHESPKRTCYDGKPHAWDTLTCIEAPTEDPNDPVNPGACSGAPVEYRSQYRGLRAIPRCGKHHDAYWDRMDKINARYPDSAVPPADFDPTYAGESWDED